MIDTGVLVAAFSGRDAREREGLALLGRVAKGEFGRAFVTDYIVTELLNYLVAKSRHRNYPDTVARKVLGEDGAKWNDLLRINEGLWESARRRFAGLSKVGLSFTDCTSIATVEGLGLEAILSFDAGFDGFVPRIA